MLVRISEIDQIKFGQIEKCVLILNLELDYDKLFEQFVNLRSIYKELSSYREPNSEGKLTHKISTQKDENDHREI